MSQKLNKKRVAALAAALVFLGACALSTGAVARYERHSLAVHRIRKRHKPTEKHDPPVIKETPQKQLDVTPISQYPELPTGCESVALTMALNSLGFGLKKTDIAEKYLPYGYSCITSFVGDPTTYDGAGIFPPGLTYCANNIIKERTNKYYALDTTGTKLDDLFKLIENGCPVVVWSTLYLGEPYFTDDYESYNGHDYPWYTNEHCIVLYGYDTEKNTVQVCDSRAGDVEYNADWFERIHNETGMMSLSIIVM